MDERPEQIISNIEAHRDELGRNLNELETRVRRTTDWRTYYERNPMLMVGVALGGGLLLGSTVGRRGHKDSYGSSGSWSIPYAEPGSSSTRAMGLSSAGVAGASAAGEDSRDWTRGSYEPSTGSSTGASSVGSTTMGSSGYDSSATASSSRMSGMGSSLKAAMHRSEVTETMEHIKGALVAFGIAKVKEFLTQAVPGLDQHLSEAEQKHRSQRQGLGSFDQSSHHEHGSAHGTDEHSSRLHDQGQNFGHQPHTGSDWNTRQGTSTGSTGFRGSHSEGQQGSEHQPAVTY